MAILRGLEVEGRRYQSSAQQCASCYTGWAHTARATRDAPLVNPPSASKTGQQLPDFFGLAHDESIRGLRRRAIVRLPSYGSLNAPHSRVMWADFECVFDFPDFWQYFT